MARRTSHWLKQSQKTDTEVHKHAHATHTHTAPRLPCYTNTKKKFMMYALVHSAGSGWRSVRGSRLPLTRKVFRVTLSMMQAERGLQRKKCKTRMYTKNERPSWLVPAAGTSLIVCTLRTPQHRPVPRSAIWAPVPLARCRPETASMCASC